MIYCTKNKLPCPIDKSDRKCRQNKTQSGNKGESQDKTQSEIQNGSKINTKSKKKHSPIQSEFPNYRKSANNPEFANGGKISDTQKPEEIHLSIRNRSSDAIRTGYKKKII